jgi:hypothetical protein
MNISFFNITIESYNAWSWFKITNEDKEFILDFAYWRIYYLKKNIR